MWQDAGDCYGKSADIMARMGCIHEAAIRSLDAASMFERVDPAEAIQFLRNAISLCAALSSRVLIAFALTASALAATVPALVSPTAVAQSPLRRTKAIHPHLYFYDQLI